MGHGRGQSATTLYVARQPILDGNGRVFGYELLYRGAPGDTSCTAGADLASAHVFTSAVLDFGLGAITGGRPAFLNVTTSLLIDTIDVLVPPDAVVLEVLETTAITPELIEACARLTSKGYRLALDDFVPGSDAEALLPHVAFVKVDVLTTPLDVAADLAARLRPSGVTMLAEKVEEREIYERTREAGYTLFQGYYFCRPVMQEGATIPPQQLVYMRLLAALNRPNLTAAELESLVKQDVSLSLRVLRFVNSAAVPVRTRVSTIQQALFLIGIEPIRKWASVWCLAGLNKGGTPELATLALVRARSCERVAETARTVEPSELFLVGLCSLLDAMLGRPMSEAIAELPLSAAAADALLGTRNAARTVLEAVIAHESGAWDTAAASAQRLGLSPAQLAEACTESLYWAQEAVQAGLTSAAA